MIRIGKYRCNRFLIESFNNCYLSYDNRYFIKNITSNIRIKSEKNSKYLNKFCNNIITYNNIIKTDSSNYFVYDYYPLDNLRTSNTITCPTETFYNILCIMKKIQKENYVHLDIKPENFLYEYNSNGVKIIDFEFSEKIPGSSENSLYMPFKKGTLHYICPELYFDNMVYLKSDIWSLGILYLWMLYKSEGIDFDLGTFYFPDKENIFKNYSLNWFEPKYKILVDMMIDNDYSKRKNLDEIMEYMDIKFFRE